MSMFDPAITKEINELQYYITNFYKVETKKFAIKIVKRLNVAFTNLSNKEESTIYISSENIKVRHILGHEITHTQIPIKNCFLAEGFAGLMSCKIADDCTPFWFAEKSMANIISKYFSFYIGLKNLFLQKNAFEDFSKMSTRYSYIVAASFIEWNVINSLGFAQSLLRQIKLLDENNFLARYQHKLSELEVHWLRSIGIHND